MPRAAGGRGLRGPGGGLLLSGLALRVAQRVLRRLLREVRGQPR